MRVGICVSKCVSWSQSVLGSLKRSGGLRVTTGPSWESDFQLLGACLSR